ncbi:sensor histidine kinase [Aestuariirhabdus litorea]|uniref:histidine kinase n=1 Tax=Aestuariirhabdus litorea TaxID=2528527 RepID=A0A3P3VPS2_9GAMM|nr:HAMP domain-containing sensor histidine kinase [Aestuariirhabdus litorea]RRJ82823.1 sensor histidine kinase [Aestuariirhabdus litorea]RWW92982.1 HAMP domain-containing protein [Endozoicomonadaceae bacterium GTF-13]
MLSLLSDLSYRVKVPISLALAILISGLVITVVLIGQGERDLRDDLFESARDVGGVLSNTLTPLMRHDDLWQAYRMLHHATEESGLASQRLLLVVDNQQQVYVSNQPRRFPVKADPGQGNPEVGQLLKRLQQDALITDQLYSQRSDQNLYVVLSLVDDRVRIGWLIMGYPKSLLTSRLYDLYWRVTFSAFAVIVLLIPVGWWIGKQMVKPLSLLHQSMAQVGQTPLSEIAYQPPRRKDEIGKLGEQFGQMLDSLAEKERLEYQMVASERLTAIGRVAAGVAHEINNPLGGMLNALNTFKRFSQADPVAAKTASLIERGLIQIKDTVSVLLVQARAQSHPFTPKDIYDVIALLAADARKMGVQLDFQTEGDKPTELPSTPIRQILINLTLNAIHASSERSTVKGMIRFAPEGILISVENSGPTIPTEKLGRLFEPFVTDNPRAHGHGLGLWVTYQLVQQLKGEVVVVSEDGLTRFYVHLPEIERSEEVK